MYLKRLKIKNYRCIKSIELFFNQGVNILIGENNSGKTAIIDALRISLSYGSQWRDIGVYTSDFYIDKSNPDFEHEDVEFHLFFKITNPVEAGWFFELLSINPDTGEQELQLHLRYYIDVKNADEKVRWKIWGGDNEGQTIPSDALDRLYYVYLEPLRDAVQYLKPIRGNKLGQLYDSIVTNENDRQSLADKIKDLLHGDSEWRETIDEGKVKINEHLNETSIKGKEQDVEVDFLPFEFKRLVENLRIQLPIFKDGVIEQNPEKQKYFELYQNGLGTNNLIYIAAILGNLKRKREIEVETYIALLIEEPEAHLHPQLQNILFKYLSSLNNIGFQIFISSHSPTITAKANLDSIIVLQDQNNGIKSLSITNSALNADNKKYLRKFLDVTKSQLFFSNGVLLVEGISEALLLPIFSKIIGEEYNIEKKGIEIVNINGVAFSHFAKLFNHDDENKRLNIRCCVITDDDRNHEEQESPRAQKALDLVGELLKVEMAERNFEYELFKTGENRDILLRIFQEIKPRAAGNLISSDDIIEYAHAFSEKVASNKAKSELAHMLAIKLENDSALRELFTVPPYIERAIKWVIKGE